MEAPAARHVSGLGRSRSRHTDDGRHWAPRWRQLLEAEGPPQDYDEFDRTVRGMLNRISTENARRLLPLEPLGDAEEDCAPWWSGRFAALMLSSYLQVIHTNRCARGLAMRSVDNVLPEYLDAVSPLLARSPGLVDALVAWLARLLRWHDLHWPTSRLVILASREERERETLPEHSLGRLPPELVRGRILSFLAPPDWHTSRIPDDCAGLCVGWDSPEGQKDVIAVLAHLLMFAPAPAWPSLSSFAFALAEAALAGDGNCDEGRVYLAASIIVTVAQRMERALDGAPGNAPLRYGGGYETEDSSAMRQPRRAVSLQDLRPLSLLSGKLLGPLGSPITQQASKSSAPGISRFVGSRVQAAVEHARRLQERVGAVLAV